MSHYGKNSYWDERYTKDPEPFDWYQRYNGISDKITTYIKKEDRVLMLGCGNSRITEEMYEDGYTSISNIDISKVVIDQMNEKHKEKSTVTWEVMNATSLSFSDDSFDVVFDKGTMDSILCGENSTSTVHRSLKEVYRVLKPGGVYFCVSYGKPENRLAYLENQAEFKWTVEVETVPKPTVGGELLAESKDGSHVHYIYLCKKAQE